MAIVTDGLVLYLHGACGKNNPATRVWKDLSGNGNDGQLINFNYDENSGWVDGGLRFDGVDDYVVTTKGIQFNQPFTFCLDGDFSKLTDENWGIAKKEVRPPYEFSFYQRDSSSFRFVIWQSGGAAVVHFVIPTEVVHNSSSLIFVNHMDSIVLFANGVNAQELNINTRLWDNHIATDRPLEFGVGGYSGVQKYGDLILYCVKFYNRALTDEEILQNYQAGHEWTPQIGKREATTTMKPITTSLSRKGKGKRELISTMKPITTSLERKGKGTREVISTMKPITASLSRKGVGKREVTTTVKPITASISKKLPPIHAEISTKERNPNITTRERIPKLEVD